MRICFDGGDLLCCDTCPRAFHKECISLPCIPTCTWHYTWCQNIFKKEKFVEYSGNALAAGRVVGIDPIVQITKRCIRIVETSEVETLALEELLDKSGKRLLNLNNDLEFEYLQRSCF